MNIRVHELSKQYLLKDALKDVSVKFSEGLLHALVGENGAGKSTLAKILSGSLQPSSGQIFIDEKKVHFKSSKDALHASIVEVNQTPLLATSLTAKENIRLILKGKKISSVELTDLKNKWCPQLNLNSQVKDLGGNLRFYTSLLGALLRKSQCLILDEPSAFLEPEERKNLYQNLKDLCSAGKLIIVITHSKAEALTYADTVTILRDGKLFHHFESNDEYKAYEKYLDETKGRLNNPAQIQTEETKSSPCLILENVKARPKNKPILLNANLLIKYGEITAVSGMREAALGTLEDLLTGMETENVSGKAIFYDRLAGNEKKSVITLNLKRGKLNAIFLRKHKTAIVPSDKNFRASHPDLTVNELVNVYKKHNTYEETSALIKKADIKITPQEKVYSLSGGMLQRLILERELSIDPELIIMANPMQGLDIEAQSRLCHRLLELRSQGKAVLVIGAMDFPLTLCQRVYSLESGTTKLIYAADQIVLNREETKEEEITSESKIIIEPPEIIHRTPALNKDNIRNIRADREQEALLSTDTGEVKQAAVSSADNSDVKQEAVSLTDNSDDKQEALLSTDTGEVKQAAVTSADNSDDKQAAVTSTDTSDNKQAALLSTDIGEVKQAAVTSADISDDKQEALLSTDNSDDKQEALLSTDTDDVKQAAVTSADNSDDKQAALPSTDTGEVKQAAVTLADNSDIKQAAVTSTDNSDASGDGEDGVLAAETFDTEVVASSADDDKKPVEINEENGFPLDLITPEEMAALLPSYNSPIEELGFSDLHNDSHVDKEDEEEEIAAFEVPAFNETESEKKETAERKSESGIKKHLPVNQYKTAEEKIDLSNFKFEPEPILKHQQEKNHLFKRNKKEDNE